MAFKGSKYAQPVLVQELKVLEELQLYVYNLPFRKMFDKKPYYQREVFTLVVSREQHRVFIFSFRLSRRRHDCTIDIYDCTEGRLLMVRINWKCKHARVRASRLGGCGTQIEMIEVEKHFSIGPETRPRLTALGAKQTLREEFRDVYFETVDCKLMTSDHWLRKRDGKWQLKHPVLNTEALDTEQFSRTERYYELEDAPAIITQLRNVIAIDEAILSLDCLVEEKVLQPVADFSTFREGWAWPDRRMGERVSIELDEASFNYSVGSVEVIVSVENEVPAAQATVREIAGKIGMCIICAELSNSTQVMTFLTPPQVMTAQTVVPPTSYSRISNCTTSRYGNG